MDFKIGSNAVIEWLEAAGFNVAVSDVPRLVDLANGEFSSDAERWSAVAIAAARMAHELVDVRLADALDRSDESDIEGRLRTLNTAGLPVGFAVTVSDGLFTIRKVPTDPADIDPFGPASGGYEVFRSDDLAKIEREHARLLEGM